MPRAKKTVSVSPSQAKYIVERAVADGKLSAADINSYMSSLSEEISTLEARLMTLRTTIVEPVKTYVREHFTHAKDKPAEGGDGPFPKTDKKRKKKAKAVTPERKASMQLQGQYLGLLAKLPANQKEKIKKLAKDEGREAAIKAMKSKG